MNVRNTLLPILLSILLSLFTFGTGRAQTNADGTYTIPIYQNPDDLGPSHYTIYASFGGSPLLPYLFDTGAPNFFSFYNTNTSDLTTNGLFTFSTGLTYYYDQTNVAVSLGDSNGVIASTGPVNLAEVRYTQSDIFSTSPITPSTSGTNPIGDGTYGDFGAGFYGSSTLATVLSQIPLDGSLKVGYTLNMTTNAMAESLTLGLSAASLAAASNAPGAIVMALSPTGTLIPTASGTVAGYNKAQVSNVALALTQNGVTTNTEIPFVLDTGGGPNAVIYATNLAGFDGATNMTVSSTNGQLLYSITSNNTPWDGGVDIDANLAGGSRLNSGGYFFQSNIVTFDLADGVVIIDPVPEPSTGSLLALAIAGIILFWNLRHRRSHS
jgi:hypothetical protein